MRARLLRRLEPAVPNALTRAQRTALVLGRQTGMTYFAAYAAWREAIRQAERERVLELIGRFV